MSTISASTTTTTAYKVTADTTGALVFQTGASPATALTIDTSQNVGIGTASPAEKLQVIGSIRVSNSGTFYSTTYSAGNSQTWMVNNATSGDIFLTSDTAQRYRQLTGVGHVWETAASGTAGGAVSFTERMRIDSSGNLLVGGTTSPSGTANIYAGSRVYVGTTTADPTFSRSTGLALVSNGAILSRSAAGWDCGLSSTSGTNISFYTDNGSARVTAGYISSNGSTTAYNVTSDYRLKQNVLPLTNSLETVSQLKPCTYSYIEGDQYSEGFIAHELQAVVPHAVTGEKDAVDENGNPKYQGVDASFLIPLLTAAIQELKAELDAAKADIATLKGAA